MRIRSILFVGRRNAARSIMAEACFNAAAIPLWRAFSAGWQPAAEVDRVTLRVLARNGFATDALAPKPIAIFRQAGAPQIDLCVFLDTVLPPDISSYPASREYWQVSDPSRAPGAPGASGTSGGGHEAALEAVTGRIGEMILSGRLFGEGDLPLAS